jgi:hypothetical protein
VIYWALAIATVALVGGFFLAYRMLIHYERVGAEHLAADTRVAIRVDLQNVILFEPIRRHLLPLLAEGAHGKDRPDRFRDNTGVLLGRDLREVVVSFGASPADWVVGIGGTFPYEGVIAGIAKTLSEEGIPGIDLGADDTLSLPFASIHGAQARDGLVLFAPDRARLEAALRPSNTFERLGFEREGPFGLAVAGSALSEAPPLPKLPALPDLSSVLRIVGRATLGQNVVLLFDFECRDAGAASALAREISLTLTAARALSALVAAQFGGTGEVLSRAEVAEVRDQVVTLSATWTRDEVDRGAEQLAAWLRRR